MFEILIAIGLFLIFLVLLLRYNTPTHHHHDDHHERAILHGITELMIPNAAGLVLKSDTQAVRVGGDGTTFSLNKGTKNQIQFFTDNDCVAAFDVSGLLIKDNYPIAIGTSTDYLSISHSTTTSIINATTSLNLKAGASEIVILELTASSIKPKVPITVTDALSATTLSTSTISGEGVVTITNTTGAITQLEITPALLALGNASLSSCTANFSGANAKIKVGSLSLMNYLYSKLGAY